MGTFLLSSDDVILVVRVARMLALTPLPRPSEMTTVVAFGAGDLHFVAAQFLAGFGELGDGDFRI